MKPFFFQGQIPASKSMMNRALIVQSLFPDFKIIGDSVCDDVVKMKKAILQFPKSSEIECGDAGTVLRFMALRASREKGMFRMKGSQRLFERPQDDLLFVLQQLQVNAQLLPNELVMQSNGWKKPLIPIHIHREKSSQFATGLLFSCWDLPFPIEFQLTPVGLKDSYWNMSIAFAESLGMVIEKKSKDRFRIAEGQIPKFKQVKIEPDFSSVFSIAAAAAIGGEARIVDVQSSSIQPDYAFIEIMKNMKVPILLEKNILGIMKAPRLLPLDISVQETPDLFPVLCVLCAFAQGESKIFGAPRLFLKESHRIHKTAELLQLMGVKLKKLKDGLVIFGESMHLKPRDFAFEPDQDHCIAMAAGILMRAGWNIELKTPDIVKKSFPEFWKILGLQP